MRCKVGDLAVIVSSVAGNEGKVVQCLRLDRDHRFIGPEGRYEADAWAVDRMLIGCFGGRHNFVPDNQLRPIRDNDGLDQTLTWKQLPSPLEIIKELSS